MCVKGTDLFLKHPVLSKFRLKTLGTPEHLRTNVHFADLRLSKRSTQHSRVLQILPKFRNKISFCFGIVFICLFSHEMKTMRIEWLERPLLRVWILRLETCVSRLARHTDVTPSARLLGSVPTSIWGLFRVEVWMSDACAEAEVSFLTVKWLNVKSLVFLPPSSHFKPPHAPDAWQGRHSVSFSGLRHFGDCRNRCCRRVSSFEESNVNRFSPPRKLHWAGVQASRLFTGSGKTASFLLPTLERLCVDTQSGKWK